MSKCPVGRFAPSPSGRMHLGNVFCALMAWLSAKSSGGKIFLRIEDIDTGRCRPEYTAMLLDDLEYLGLSFDQSSCAGSGEVYRQSEHTQRYLQRFLLLREQGAVYPCFCSRNELHASLAPHGSPGRPVYPGTCRNLSEEERWVRMSARSPAYRLKVPDKDICFTDRVFGAHRQNPAQEWGDFILLRSDSVFSYQLASVSDDIDMGVTEVVRGRDLLPSVPPQLVLYDLFGADPPDYMHIPLLVDKTGRRLSKRDCDLDMGALRRRFPSSAALIGKLLFLAGMQEEPFPLKAKEALKVFSSAKLKTKDIVVTEELFSGSAA